MNEQKRAELFAEHEAMGEPKVRHMVEIKGWLPADPYRHNTGQEWLHIQESLAAARAEARETESLSNSRKAIRIARWANIIAISAMVLSVATAIAIAFIK